MRGAFMKKVKDSGAKAAHSTLVVSILVLAAAFAVFFLLPVIFEESGPLDLQGYDSGYTSSSKQDSGFLPLFKSLNPFTYFKKAYGVFSGKKDNVPQRIYYADGTFDDIDFEDIIGPNDAQAAQAAQEAAAAEEENAAFEEQTALSPDDTGYYYNGQRYKYGEYPANVSSEEIEKAISKWHNNQAARSGRSAVYMQDENGDLFVKYFNEKEIGDYFAMLKNQQNPSVEGVGIAQEDGSIYTGLLAGKGEKARSFGQLSSFGKSGDVKEKGDTGKDIENQFNLLMGKAKEIEKNHESSVLFSSSYNNSSSGKNSDKSRKRRGPNLEEYLNDTSDDLSGMFLRRIESKEKAIPANQIPDEYKNVPAKFDNEIYMALSGILGQELLPPKSNVLNIRELQKEVSSTGENVRFYSRYPVPREIRDRFQKRGIFFNSFSNPEYEKGNGFTETFFKKTAVEEILVQLKTKEESIKGIETVYQKMDEKREKIKKLYPKDSSVIFILGKDPKNDKNIIVASDINFLNVYAEGKTPQWIKDYNSGKGVVVSVPTKDLAKKITQKGVVVVTANRESPPPIPGVPTLNIKRDNLFTISPKEIWENQKDIARIVFKSNREESKALFKSFAQRQKEKQDVEESLKSMSTAVNEAVEGK